MVLRYRADGTASDDGSGVVPPKPGKLKPLDGEAPTIPDSEAARRIPSSGQEAKRPSGTGAEDGLIQPRPPAEPRPSSRGDSDDKVSPKTRQLQQQTAKSPSKGGRGITEDSAENSSASTTDTPHAAEAVAEQVAGDIAEATRLAGQTPGQRRASARKSLNACILAGEPIELANFREYIDHLYRQSEQLWMWREMDAHAKDHSQTKDEEEGAEDAAEAEDDAEGTHNFRMLHHAEIGDLGDEDEDDNDNRGGSKGSTVPPLPGCGKPPGGKQQPLANGDPNSPEYKKALAVRRQSAFILQFAGPKGGFDAPEDEPLQAAGGAAQQQPAGGGVAPEEERPKPEANKQDEAHPLKCCLTSKKINIKMVRGALETTDNLRHWLEVPLCVGPPLVPKPLVCAVSTIDQKLIELLLEFKADVGVPYEGPAMYKGWVKPGQSLLHSVNNRKGRFVGTMLADKLEGIEKVLMNAEAEQGARSQSPTVDELQPMEVKQCEQTRTSCLGISGNTRVSVKVKSGIGEQLFTHTQGHPRDVYEISGLLGDGDTSTCWEGWHSVSRAPVAIKAECKSDEVMIWEEINKMRKFEHPNVSRLEETFENESQVFMVLELCEGGRLFDSLIDKSGTIQRTARDARLMSHLARGVGHLHDKSICHRDVQLENFLLTAGPLNKAVVKLIDFTTSKEFGPGKAPMKTKICTPSYVAREILSRKPDAYTEKIDIWSLGVVYFIMLCGTLPFVGETDFEVLKKVKSGKYKFEPADVWAEVDDKAQDLAKKMICSKPEERLSATEVLGHPWLASAKE